MPFGLTNAPTIFQFITNNILKSYIRHFDLVFFDILIYSISMEQHKDHLKQILQTIQENKLFLKQTKCMFAQTQVATSNLNETIKGILGINMVLS